MFHTPELWGDREMENTYLLVVINKTSFNSQMASLSVLGRRSTCAGIWEACTKLGGGMDKETSISL